MDQHMPDTDGTEATQEIRRSEATRARTPSVALTASILQEDRERCLAAGMEDFLAKPVESKDLRTLLERVASERRPHWPRADRDAPGLPGLRPRLSEGIDVNGVSRAVDLAREARLTIAGKGDRDVPAGRQPPEDVARADLEAQPAVVASFAHEPIDHDAISCVGGRSG
jgi:DNA-binding response OmpR family regulator